MREGGLEPPRPIRALAPQASASTYSATRAWVFRFRNRGPTLSRSAPGSEPRVPNRAPAERFSRHPSETERQRETGRLVRMPTPETDLPEVVRIAQDLIRFDTTNFGGGRAHGEREAAEYVGAYLEALGLTVEFYEPIPRRTNLMARVPGRDPSKPALVLHGHLDVVPAIAEDWSVDPFAGEIRDGLLWGRGAVDMKDMDAMILASVAELLRAGEQPERDLVAGVLRRRGERRHRRLRARRARPAGVVRRCDRGDQRGRRLFDLRGRPAGVPAAGRREGAGVDPAGGARSGGPRQPVPPRQRGDPPRRGRRGPRAHRVAHPPHRHDPAAARRARRAHRRRPRRT